MWLASLHSYPVKGCHRVDHDAAQVQRCGLAGDRRWLIIDGDGEAVTQREEPRLTGIFPSAVEGRLWLRAAGATELAVPEPAGAPVAVSVFRRPLKATPAGPAADAWLTAVLDRPVRLVWLDDPDRRPVNPAYAEPGDRVSFADGYPVLLANADSLDAFNGWLLADGSPGEAGGVPASAKPRPRLRSAGEAEGVLAGVKSRLQPHSPGEAEGVPASAKPRLQLGSPEGPLPMTRFRPNVVVAGAGAWAEDGWVGRRLRIGTVTFRVPKPSDRCVVTTTDQETGERGREPLRTLAKYRNVGQKLLFGTNLIPDGTGRIAVGDPVVLLDPPA